jgi:AraC-like DNA-binding protein
MSETKEFHRYLPISPRDKQWGLYVTGAGYAKIPPADRLHIPSYETPPLHKLSWKKGRLFDEYGITYITAGKGEFESKASGQVIVETGVTILLFPEVWHRFRPLAETGWHEYWLTFQGEFAQRLQKNGFISPEIPLYNTGLQEGILHAFTAIFDRLRSETIGYHQLITVNTLQILTEVLAVEQHRQTDSNVYDLVCRARAMIEEQTEGLPEIEELASTLGVSGGYFRHIFKHHTGFSPYQYYLQLQISRAKSMLRSSDFSIKQIAKALGFQNVYHFSKLFKSKTRMTPVQWRSADKVAGGE